MKNVFPPTKIVAIRNYLLCERQALWFTSTVTLCRPALSIDVSPRILSIPAPATTCPFSINNSFSMWSAPNKVKYFGNANSGYFHWIFLRVYIGWPKQSTAVICWGFEVFIFQVNVPHLLIMEKWNYSIVLGSAHVFFLHDTSSMRVYSVVSADTKFSIQVNVSFWWSLNIISHQFTSYIFWNVSSG